jgi:hypothetical protein
MEKAKRALWVAVVIGLPIAVVAGVYAWADGKIVAKRDSGPLFFQQMHDTAVTSWIALAAGMAVLIVLAGWLSKKEIFGALIDQQNRYSLSRLQVATWTTVVLSVWLAVVIVRVASKIPVGDALQVEIPDAVLVVLGISVGSFAFSSGIKDAKRKQEVTPTTRIQVEQELRKAEESVNDLTRQLAEANEVAANASNDTKAAFEMQVRSLTTALDAATAKMDVFKKQDDAYKAADGLLVKNSSPSDATACDLFRGVETSDSDTLDFGKVQMLWITIAVVAAYVFVLVDALAGNSLYAKGTVTLPDFPASIVALLGISHGGYLAVKASSSQQSETKS